MLALWLSLISESFLLLWRHIHNIFWQLPSFDCIGYSACVCVTVWSSQVGWADALVGIVLFSIDVALVDTPMRHFVDAPMHHVVGVVVVKLLWRRRNTTRCVKRSAYYVNKFLRCLYILHLGIKICQCIIHMWTIWLNYVTFFQNYVNFDNFKLNIYIYVKNHRFMSERFGSICDLVT